MKLEGIRETEIQQGFTGNVYCMFVANLVGLHIRDWRYCAEL